MGAIFGQLCFDDSVPIGADLERMAEASRHRAPDGIRHGRCGPAAFGHGAMALHHEDRFDRQPLCDADVMLVADCRLDNRRELAAELSIAEESLAEMADSALILAAYRQWGEGCVARLLGDFAFALWDGARGELLLARDHAGQAMLHYWQDSERIVFASEAKALFALPQVPRKLCEREMAIQGARAGHPLSDGRTLFEGVHAIVGGRYRVISLNGISREHEYWQPAAAPEHIGRDEAYYVENYRRILSEAVACRVCRLIDPPGLLLSGGFDSSAIAALAGQALPAQLKLLTETSALPKGVEHPQNARPYAADCIAHMPHLDHQWYLSGAPPAPGDFERRMAALDQPVLPVESAAGVMFARLRARGSRLVMDGIGGDASLNPRGVNILAELIKAGQLRTAFREFRAELRASGRSLWQVLRSDLVAALIPVRWRLWRAMRRKDYRLVANDYLRAAKVEALLAEGVVEPYNPLPFYQQEPSLVSRTGTLNILRHRAEPHGALDAAVQGLVLTRPMLDKRLIEFGLAVPLDLQVVRGRNRYLARRALADALPPSFQDRPRGQEGFAPTMHESLRAALPEMRAEVARMRENAQLQQWFDLDRVAAELDRSPEAVFPEGRQSYLIIAYGCARYVAWVNRLNY